jgi:hypothetical protein
VQRDWEINFFDSAGPTAVPAMLPDKLDLMADDLFTRLYGETQGYAGSQPAKTRNRDSVMMDRFHAFFRGPIEQIDVYYFEKFHGDLGAALARFPVLRRVTVFDDEEDGPTESEWTLLCTRLRALPQLETLRLGGDYLTNESIAPLAGHPQLRSIIIREGRLTAACAKTFASIPHLSQLHIEQEATGSKTWLSPEGRKAMIAALPHVNLELPDDDE